jgi:hypothetical protein
VAIQSYGDTLNFHPHLHSLVPDGAWDRSGTVSRISYPDSQILTRLFAHHVREMLISKRRLSRDFANRLASWHHSGFHVYCSRPVDQDDKPALERLAAYILRPSFAASRLQYDPQQGRVEYRTAKGIHRTLDALDSTPATGKGASPAADLEESSAAEQFSQQRRRSWARLLRKVYEIDPLECPQCGHALEIIAVIEQSSVIRKILQHLDRWEQPQRAPPPRLFPQKLESFLASLSPQQAQAVRASSDALFWDDVPIWED